MLNTELFSPTLSRWKWINGSVKWNSDLGPCRIGGVLGISRLFTFFVQLILPYVDHPSDWAVQEEWLPVAGHVKFEVVTACMFKSRVSWRMENSCSEKKISMSWCGRRNSKTICLATFNAIEQLFLVVNSVTMSLHKFMKNLHLAYFSPRGYYSLSLIAREGNKTRT